MYREDDECDFISSSPTIEKEPWQHGYQSS